MLNGNLKTTNEKVIVYQALIGDVASSADDVLASNKATTRTEAVILTNFGAKKSGKTEAHKSCPTCSALRGTT